MDQLDKYFELQREIYEYFGYVEDWVVLPIEDSRDYYWMIVGGEEHGGEVHFAETPEELHDEDGGAKYSSEIYTQRFLPKWVYRGKDYTMICTNPGVDGNRFLSIFSNDKEVKEDAVEF